ncbi:MAG TPA: hypothetical protein VIX19_09880 [Terriglobales bacterium]
MRRESRTAKVGTHGLFADYTDLTLMATGGQYLIRNLYSAAVVDSTFGSKPSTL